jgi:hypothetical protein
MDDAIREVDRDGRVLKSGWDSSSGPTVIADRQRPQRRDGLETVGRGNPDPQFPPWFNQHGTNCVPRKYVRNIVNDDDGGSSRVTVTIINRDDDQVPHRFATIPHITKFGRRRESTLATISGSFAQDRRLGCDANRSVEAECLQEHRRPPPQKSLRGVGGEKIEQDKESSVAGLERLDAERNQTPREGKGEGAGGEAKWILDALFGSDGMGNENGGDEPLGSRVIRKKQPPRRGEEGVEGRSGGGSSKRKPSRAATIIHIDFKTARATRATTVPTIGKRRKRQQEKEAARVESESERDLSPKRDDDIDDHRREDGGCSKPVIERKRKESAGGRSPSTSSGINRPAAGAMRQRCAKGTRLRRDEIAAADKEVFRAIGYLCATFKDVMPEWTSKPVIDPTFASEVISRSKGTCDDKMAQHKEAFNLRLAACILLGRASFVAARVPAGMTEDPDPWKHPMFSISPGEEGGWLKEFVEWMESQGVIVTIRFESAMELIERTAAPQQWWRLQQQHQARMMPFFPGATVGGHFQEEPLPFSSSLMANPMMPKTTAKVCGLFIPHDKQASSMNYEAPKEKYMIVEAFLPLPTW